MTDAAVGSHTQLQAIAVRPAAHFIRDVDVVHTTGWLRTIAQGVEERRLSQREARWTDWSSSSSAPGWRQQGASSVAPRAPTPSQEQDAGQGASSVGAPSSFPVEPSNAEPPTCPDGPEARSTPWRSRKHMIGLMSRAEAIEYMKSLPQLERQRQGASSVAAQLLMAAVPEHHQICTDDSEEESSEQGGSSVASVNSSSQSDLSSQIGENV